MGIFTIFKSNRISDRVQELVREQALIIDVRTVEEYAVEHIVGSVNIPLGTISGKLDELRAQERPVVTCCRSGARSRMAAEQLCGEGIDAENGGSWSSLKGFM